MEGEFQRGIAPAPRLFGDVTRNWLAIAQSIITLSRETKGSRHASQRSSSLCPEGPA